MGRQYQRTPSRDGSAVCLKPDQARQKTPKPSTVTANFRKIWFPTPPPLTHTFPKSRFEGLSEYTPHTPTCGTLSGHKRGKKGYDPLKRTKLAQSAPMPRDMAVTVTEHDAGAPSHRTTIHMSSGASRHVVDADLSMHAPSVQCRVCGMPGNCGGGPTPQNGISEVAAFRP